jgi:hypothetical protein
VFSRGLDLKDKCIVVEAFVFVVEGDGFGGEFVLGEGHKGGFVDLEEGKRVGEEGAQSGVCRLEGIGGLGFQGFGLENATSFLTVDEVGIHRDVLSFGLRNLASKTREWIREWTRE